MKKIDYDNGIEILKRAMFYLIDIDSGNFERLLMATNEVFSLERDYLYGDAVKVFFEIDSMFDKNNYDEKQNFCWKNVSSMGDDKKQKLAEAILRLYTEMCQAPVKNPDIFKQ